MHATLKRFIAALSEFGTLRQFATTQHFVAFGAKRTLHWCFQQKPLGRPPAADRARRGPGGIGARRAADNSASGHLIAGLQGLREKLNSDGDRLHRDIAQHAAFSQAVVDLTKIVSDGMTSVNKSGDLVGTFFLSRLERPQTPWLCYPGYRRNPRSTSKSRHDCYRQISRNGSGLIALYFTVLVIEAWPR
jgi:hypothetical protein